MKLAENRSERSHAHGRRQQLNRVALVNGNKDEPDSYSTAYDNVEVELVHDQVQLSTGGGTDPELRALIPVVNELTARAKQIKK